MEGNQNADIDTFKTTNLTFDTPIQVTTYCHQSASDPDINSDIQAVNESGDFYYLTHEADFTGNHCEFEFDPSFTTNDEVSIPAHAYAGLEKNVKDGIEKGYKLVIREIDL